MISTIAVSLKTKFPTMLLSTSRLSNTGGDMEALVADTPSSDLPAYSLPSEDRSGSSEVEHEYTAKDSKDRPWFILRVKSRAGGVAYNFPRIVEGQPLTGSVILDLKDNTTIKYISVVTYGELILPGAEKYSFIGAGANLWRPEKGFPGVASTATTGTAKQPAKYKGKLRGEFTFPFSLTYPSTVKLNHGTQSSYRLPSSFKDTRASINYRIVATVARGIIKTEHHIGTNIHFTPHIQPPSPSPAREIAYMQRTPLPGPLEDPEGWHILPSVSVRGRIFDTRDVELQYTLSLANPLSYTKGASIPVSLAIASSDSQALDLLSSPKAPILHLLRVLSMQYDSSQADSTIERKFIPLSELKAVRTVAFRDQLEIAGIAAWWPESSPVGSVDRVTEQTRVLQGEIHLRSTQRLQLYPSAHLGHYKLSYQVTLFPPADVAGFVPACDPKATLQKCDVEIATVFPEGPRPCTYSTPVEVPESKLKTAVLLAASGFV